MTRRKKILEGVDLIEVFAFYNEGFSMKATAEEFSLSRHMVKILLEENKIPIREIKKREFVAYKGVNYYKTKKDYYRESNKGGQQMYLHRKIWEDYNGPIPKGYEIHHKDRDRSNNDIGNLVMLSESEHKKYHNKNRRKYQ